MTWEWSSCTVDVSGLSDGTTYDVTFSCARATTDGGAYWNVTEAIAIAS
jgi:hypothetical protein